MVYIVVRQDVGAAIGPTGYGQENLQFLEPVDSSTFKVLQLVHAPVKSVHVVQLVPQLGQLFDPSLYFPAPQLVRAAQVVPISTVPDGHIQFVLERM